MNENAQDESTVTGKALGNVALVAGSAAAMAFAGVMAVKGARSASNKIFKMSMSDAEKGAMTHFKETMKDKSEAEILDIIKEDRNLRKNGKKIQKEAQAFHNDEHFNGSKKMNAEIEAENKRVADAEARKAANEAAAKDRNPGNIAGTYEGDEPVKSGRKVRRDRFKNKATAATKTGKTPQNGLQNPVLEGGNQTDYTRPKHSDYGYNQEDIINAGHERHEQAKADRRKQRSEDRKRQKTENVNRQQTEFQNQRQAFFDDINTNYGHSNTPFGGRQNVDYTQVPHVNTGYGPKNRGGGTNKFF